MNSVKNELSCSTPFPLGLKVLYEQTMRRLCSGKTLAFQAKDAGSIPARRSRPPKITPPQGPATHHASRCFHKGYVIVPARRSFAHVTGASHHYPIGPS